jgi:hypothetical protein
MKIYHLATLVPSCVSVCLFVCLSSCLPVCVFPDIDATTTSRAIRSNRKRKCEQTDAAIFVQTAFVLTTFVLTTFALKTFILKTFF